MIRSMLSKFSILSNGTLSESVQQSITSHLKNSFSSAQVKFFNGGAKTLNLRFPPRTDKEEVSKILHQVSLWLDLSSVVNILC